MTSDRTLRVGQDGDDWRVWLPAADDGRPIVFQRFAKKPSDKTIRDLTVVINQALYWAELEVKRALADVPHRIKWTAKGE
jgi:hypothetical protein